MLLHHRWIRAGILSVAAFVLLFTYGSFAQNDDNSGDQSGTNSQKLLAQGKQTFRFDTFGDEAFWGDTLKLHQAIEGSKFGGVGPGVSPAAALSVGLKVDADALPDSLVEQVKDGQVNLNDPATTLALLKLNAVVGVTGFFNSDGSLKSIGIQCALCHSTVDNSFKTSTIPAGNIGHRMDGWPNRDLNVGAIINLAPDLSAVDKVLGVDDATVRKVLMSWGPGKFDAELILDGKAFRPDGGSGATLLPPAYGLAGVNLHTWTGWGSIPYWNAFVAVLEMHGKGRFFDPRLNDPNKFPVAAKNGFFDVKIDASQDRVTPKLAGLHFYQLSLPAPKPEPNPFDFAVKRGDELFSGKAKCNSCHTEPARTEPGWNMHTAKEVCIDDFQASRAPDDRYRTAPLSGIFFHQKGGFYHDGRFKTMKEVIDHYNAPGCMNLQLTDSEINDLIAYVFSL